MEAQKLLTAPKTACVAATVNGSGNCLQHGFIRAAEARNAEAQASDATKGNMATGKGTSRLLLFFAPRRDRG